jgi:spermidine synthase
MAAPRNFPALGRWLTGLYFVSGAVSLAYEVLWARMLSVQFGVSIFGVVVTVCAFMVGLGVGSLVGTSVSARVQHPLRYFAMLELGVGLFALLVPFIAPTVNAELSAFAPGVSLTTWFVFQLAAAFVLLLIPAFAMGAGFPLLLAAARDTDASLGRVYGFNALGGVVGALAPLGLLPVLGWLATAQSFAAAGIVVSIIAFALAARRTTAVANSTTVTITLPPKLTLLMYAGIGAAALMLEISWTRVFGMIMLRTEYVLAVIIAVFLLGIGSGSVLAKRLTHARWLLILPVVASVGAVLTLWFLAPVSRAIEASHFSSLSTALVAQGTVLALLTLPVTFALGAWLPLLAKRVGGDAKQGAWLYGVNSLGAAFGTLVAGFVFIPLVGTAATIAIATLLLLFCGLVLAQARRAWFAFVLAAISLWPVLSLPPVAALLPRALGETHDVLVYEDALSLTHVVERSDGQRVLLDDLQRMDAASDPDAVVVQQNQARLPLLLHPQAHTVLFLGMGTGISASGALAYPDLQLTAVELSRGAVIAARDWFAPVNNDIVKHMRIVRDDARRFLVSDRAYYDVIIGDLFHPDLAGRSALLSVEQFTRARARLNTGGVFVQWIALNQFDAASLDIVLRSFSLAFPQGVVFIDPFRLALVGSKDRAVNASDVLTNLARLSAEARNNATGGEGAWTWLGRYFGPIKSLVRDDGDVQHETAPRIEYLLPKARYRGELDLAALLTQLLKQRPAWQRAADELQLPVDTREQFEKSYSATELALAGWVAALRGKAEEGNRLLQLAYQANPQDRWVGVALVTPIWSQLEAMLQQGARVQDTFGKDARDVLAAILRIRPDHVPALKMLLNLEQVAGNQQRVDELRVQLIQLSPLDHDATRR